MREQLGGVVHTWGYADEATSGLVTPQTIFEIGSVTKSFTAIQLALSLNDPAVHVKLQLNDSPLVFLPPPQVALGDMGKMTLQE